MKTYFFKTSINCNGCLSRVKPQLDAKPDIKFWKVDLDSPDKILTVECESLQASDIIEIIDNAGYEIEQLES
ncbi:MAG: heavy-metal-associated domain-containing protein [Bacteroidota bacterium]